MNWWWYITRATGIVAVLLGAASMLWGLLFSSRQTGKRLRPAWWLDLHNWLGGLALIFTVAHVVAVLADSDAGYTLARALVPGVVKQQTAAIAFGILGLYGFVAVVATSWPRLRLHRRLWRVVHLLSVPALVLAGLHGYQAGSDQRAVVFQGVLVVAAAVSVYGIALRLLGVLAGRRSA